MNMALPIALIVGLVAAIFTGQPAIILIYLFFVMFLIRFALWPMGPSTFAARSWAIDEDQLLLYGDDAREKLVTVFKLDPDLRLVLADDHEIGLMGHRIRFRRARAAELFKEIRSRTGSAPTPED